MSLILAIEPDARQAAQIKTLATGRLKAELIIAASAERALAALGSRVPDLVLSSTLLAWHDESAVAAHLRELGDAAAHVQTLTIPILAPPRPAAGKKGVLSRLRKASVNGGTDGCDPDLFAEQIRLYLDQATATSIEHALTADSTTEGIAATAENPIVRTEIEFAATVESVSESTENILVPTFEDSTALTAETALALTESTLAPTADHPIAAADCEFEFEFDLGSTVDERIAPIQLELAPTLAVPIAQLAPILDVPMAPTPTGIAPTLAVPIAPTQIELAPTVIEFAPTLDVPVAPPAIELAPTLEVPIAPNAIEPAPTLELRVAPWVPISLQELYEAIVVSSGPAEIPRAEDVWVLEPVAMDNVAVPPTSPDRQPTPIVIASPEPVLVARQPIAAPTPAVHKSVECPLEMTSDPLYNSPVRKKQAVRPRRKPAQDEWGVFDPDQCGFAALVARLDEITKDGSQAPRADTTVRVIAY